MKLNSILGSLIGLSSVLFLFTSCTKDMEDIKGERDVANLNGIVCSPCEGMYLKLATLQRGEAPFFFRDAQLETIKALKNIDPNCKQTFNKKDFSNQQFFVVTGGGGTLQHNPDNGAIGINDDYINAGESVTLTLSECMNAYDLQSMHITLNGGERDFATVCLMRGDVLVDDVKVQGRWNPKTPGKGALNFPVEFHARGSEASYFDKIVIKTTAGKMFWRGYQPNGNTALYYDPTYFHLVKLPL